MSLFKFKRNKEVEYIDQTKAINDMEIKAGKIELQGSLSIFTNNRSLNGATLPSKDLINLNKGWVYVANNKNALQVASTPIKLYYDKSKKTNKKLFTPNKQVKAHKSIVNKLITKQNTNVNNIVEIEDHPFLNLLKNINPYMNYTDFAFLIHSYLGLIGNAFVKIELDNIGLPSALYVLNSEYITIIKSKNNNEIIGYKYDDSATKITYEPKEIIHFVNYAPGNTILGRGELESCLNAVLRYNYYDQYENGLNANNACPSFAVMYKNLSESEKNDVYKSWFKRFGGPANAGKPIITSDAEVKMLGFAPKDMEYGQGREWARQEILAAFGVPDSLVVLNASNLASAKSATSHYMKYTIIPKLSQYCEKLNEKLLPLYDENLYCWYEVSLESDPAEQSTILSTYVNSRILTIDEAREQLGLSTMEVKEDKEEVNEEEVVVEGEETNKKEEDINEE